jgi:hypothetical protein
LGLNEFENSAHKNGLEADLGWRLGGFAARVPTMADYSSDEGDEVSKHAVFFGQGGEFTTWGRNC